MFWQEIASIKRQGVLLSICLQVSGIEGSSDAIYGLSKALPYCGLTKSCAMNFLTVYPHVNAVLLLRWLTLQ